MSAGDERILIARAKAGDLLSFEALVKIYRKHIHQLAYRMVNNVEDAEDITQETFIRAYQKIDSLRQGSLFRAWVSNLTLLDSKVVFAMMGPPC